MWNRVVRLLRHVMYFHAHCSIGTLTPVVVQKKLIVESAGHKLKALPQKLYRTFIGVYLPSEKSR